ncbi:MAG: hypothetical protein ACFFAY_16475 [Promethearchaeota archaeon]
MALGVVFLRNHQDIYVYPYEDVYRSKLSSGSETSTLDIGREAVANSENRGSLDDLSDYLPGLFWR